MHCVVSGMMGSRDLRWRRSVNESAGILLEGSLRGELWRAMLVSGLNRLGRKTRTLGGVVGSIVVRAWVVMAWQKCRYVCGL